MSKYDDLLPREREMLPRIVDGWLENDEQPLHLHTWPDESCSGRFKAELVGISPALRVMDVPPHSEFYLQLYAKGYLYTSSSSGWALRVGVDKKGYDFSQYARMGSFRQRLDDLAYDLGTDTSLRSKIVWTGVAVFASLAGTFVMRSLGWL